MVKSYIPSTYNEALDILAAGDMTIMAGGTDLMVKKRNWAGLLPEFKKDMVFISDLKELKYIEKRGGFIHIGSMTTLEFILNNKNTPVLLKKAVHLMASPGIRHIATIGGNIGNASPAGDTLPVLYLLDAKIVLDGKDSERMVPIEEFITGPGSTDLRKGELIREIILNDVEFDEIYYEKIGGRKADAISKLSFAAGASFKNNNIEDFRVAFGAVAPVIVRRRELEKKAIGKNREELNVAAASFKEEYKSYINPIDDQRSTAVYRKACCVNLLDKFLRILTGEISKAEDKK